VTCVWLDVVLGSASGLGAGHLERSVVEA
jgi:hypothetical protein